MNRSTPNNLDILYEDNHYIAINKKIGDLIQGDNTKDMPLNEIVKAYLKKKYNKPGNTFIGVIHRLDRPVSGVVLFAKTSKGLSRANKLFADKAIQKSYWAIVENLPRNPTHRLSHWLVRNQSQNKSYAYDKIVPKSKQAELSYSTLQSFDKYYLLNIDLHTGRHHQIRAQLSKIGCPIKGDLKYGAKRSNKDGGISLHARTLTFEHPIKKNPTSIVAPTPNESLWNIAEKSFPEILIDRKL